MITFKRIVCFASVASLLFFLSACETTPTVHRPGETPQIHKRVALLEIEEYCYCEANWVRHCSSNYRLRHGRIYSKNVYNSNTVSNIQMKT